MVCRLKMKYAALSGEESHKDHDHSHSHPLCVGHALPGWWRFGDRNRGLHYTHGVQAGTWSRGAYGLPHQYCAPQLSLRTTCGLQRLPHRTPTRRLCKPEQEHSHGRSLQVCGLQLCLPGIYEPSGLRENHLTADTISTCRPVHPLHADGYRTLDPSYRAHSRSQLDPYAAQPQVGSTVSAYVNTLIPYWFSDSE